MACLFDIIFYLLSCKIKTYKQENYRGEIKQTTKTTTHVSLSLPQRCWERWYRCLWYMSRYPFHRGAVSVDIGVCDTCLVIPSTEVLGALISVFVIHVSFSLPQRCWERWYRCLWSGWWRRCWCTWQWSGLSTSTTRMWRRMRCSSPQCSASSSMSCTYACCVFYCLQLKLIWDTKQAIFS